MALKRLKTAVPAAALALAALLSLCGGAAAQAPDATVVHPDYSDPRLWLCRPDLQDNRCRVNLDATVIEADGTTSVEPYRPAQSPGIDCFFVYPTVSNDETWQSDFSPDEAEWDDIRLQFARFGQVCRQFAPLYRQGTLRRLRVAVGGPLPVGEQPAPDFGGYADVRAAWDWYMAHENHGRGVVLIGHSQGGAVITRLIAQEIDGKPAQTRLVSALVLGAPVMVPPGADVGGSFAHVPLCRARTQIGCVISYATFRDGLPPPPESRFGLARDGLRVACVNPANLSGGPGMPRSYFLTQGLLNRPGGSVRPVWLTPPKEIDTPFVTTPGLVSTECLENGAFNWLSMRVNADPTDPRTDELAGEIVRPTGIDLAWGLHLIDVDHSMGTLIDIVRDQGASYADR
jgi:pimeloyl-ACP methyl ester carboxylesterase